jgi:hypothetical protein
VQQTLSILPALPATRFRRLRRGPAVVVILLTLLAMGIFGALAVAYHGPIAAIISAPGKGDLATYSQIVEDMRKGEPYYTAAHRALVAGHYGTRSVFNWRLPTLSWVWSALPSQVWAKALLLAAAAVAIGLTFVWFLTAVSGPAALLALLGVALNLMSCLPVGAELLADVVAGVLILISVAAYGLRWRAAGLIAGVAALSVKELAAPYVLICVFEAWRQRRYGELFVWAMALAGFACFFFWHYQMVQEHILPSDIAYHDGWLQFGGLQFVLATAGFNGLLLAAPLWITAILLPLCLLGLSAWDGPTGERVRLTVGAYLVLFLFVGKAFDVYWGAFFTPLMMLGLPFLPRALADLGAAVLGGNDPAPATVPESP